ncbi:MAG: MarR family transcriptional regulator [Clostridia bacterium]|nr:MarR family transcriptional regulator [Clostridia bacterium]
MKGTWTEDADLMAQISREVLYSMSAYPRKLVHTDELVRKHELPFSQIQLLTLLYKQDVTVTEAAHHLNVAKTNLALLIRQLSEKGFIERIQDDVDRRKVFLHMTEKGKTEYLAMERSVAEQIARLDGKFARSEMKLLLKSLSQVNHVLNRVKP